MASLNSPIANPFLVGNPTPTDTGGSGSGSGGDNGHGGGSNDSSNDKKVTTSTSTPPTESTQAPDLASGDDAVITFFLDNKEYWITPGVLSDDLVSAEVSVYYTINTAVEDAGELTPMNVALCRYMGEGKDPDCHDYGAQSPFPRRQVELGNPLRAVHFPISEPSRDEPMFIKLDWNYRFGSAQGVVAGESTSKLFPQLKADQDPKEVLATMKATNGTAQYNGTSLMVDNTPTLPPEMESLFDANLGEESSVGTGTPTSTATIRPSANNGVATGEGDVPISSGGSGGGGLSTGAIAGIGVGAGIAVLAIIAALVWFFCLRNRRRKSKDVNGPYSAPEGQASEFMVNKETNAHITESPHSPYSDDGSLTRAAEHHYHQPQQHRSTPSYGHDAQQPYSDAPPIAAPVPRSASQQAHASERPVSRSGARSGTPAGNVSHLIEEGMTEDDIRRLEEEERALDDAIERAGHQRRS